MLFLIIANLKQGKRRLKKSYHRKDVDSDSVSNSSNEPMLLSKKNVTSSLSDVPRTVNFWPQKKSQSRLTPVREDNYNEHEESPNSSQRCTKVMPMNETQTGKKDYKNNFGIYYIIWNYY